MRQVDPAILAAPVEGMNLAPGSLRDQLAAPATLVAFLRHLHCMFCREMVADLRAAAADAAFPPVVLITQSPKEDLGDFFADRWPNVRAVADPTRRVVLRVRCRPRDVRRSDGAGGVVVRITREPQGAHAEVDAHDSPADR